jgi:hypothetical protein
MCHTMLRPPIRKNGGPILCELIFNNGPIIHIYIQLTVTIDRHCRFQESPNILTIPSWAKVTLNGTIQSKRNKQVSSPALIQQV